LNDVYIFVAWYLVMHMGNFILLTLRGYWCDIVLNMHVPTEDKRDDRNDSLYEKLGMYLINS